MTQKTKPKAWKRLSHANSSSWKSTTTTVETIYADFALFNIAKIVNAETAIHLHQMRRVGFLSCSMIKASIFQHTGSHQFFSHGNNFRPDNVSISSFSTA